MTTTIRKPYDPAVPQLHPVKEKSSTGQKPEKVTEQHHKKACDINNILAKYRKTGLIDHIQTYQGQYGNVTGADFQNAQNLVAEQKSIFEELPAEVRDQFDNDPANYLNKVMTDEGIQELQEMLNPAPEPEPQPEPEPAPEPVTTDEPAVT